MEVYGQWAIVLPVAHVHLHLNVGRLACQLDGAAGHNACPAEQLHVQPSAGRQRCGTVAQHRQLQAVENPSSPLQLKRLRQRAVGVEKRGMRIGQAHDPDRANGGPAVDTKHKRAGLRQLRSLKAGVAHRRAHVLVTRQLGAGDWCRAGG